MFEPKIRNRQTDLLMKAIIRIQDEEDAYRFFEDLCTIPEIESISQRLEVAELLRKKYADKLFLGGLEGDVDALQHAAALHAEPARRKGGSARLRGDKADIVFWKRGNGGHGTGKPL